jgi:pyridoxal phosphate enzyme (YggS family)
MSIAENTARVRERIAAPEEIRLMAVSKTFPPSSIREAHAAGLRLFGENRVQEFADKAAKLRDLDGAEWHLIGHLQTNKAAKAAELFSGIDSLDSPRLAQKLNSAAQQLGKKLPVLIEINIGGEEAKSGVLPGSPALESLLHGAAEWSHLEIRGLMTIPPFTEDPEKARPDFQKLRELRDVIATRQLPSVGMNVLSMGMSHDFDIAIEEGSTCVRVGTAIFGERTVA